MIASHLKAIIIQIQESALKGAFTNKEFENDNSINEVKVFIRPVTVEDQNIYVI